MRAFPRPTKTWPFWTVGEPQAVGDGGTRLDVAVGRDRPEVVLLLAGGVEVPVFLARGGVEAEEPAFVVVVEALADVEPAVDDERGRQHLLHRLAAGRLLVAE